MTHLPQLFQTPPRYLFFTGKGGVGKTTLSSAVALALADHGKRVLLVSTDPASNLDAVLEAELNDKPKAIAGAANLEAMNIDPEAAAAAYRERVIGPYRGVLPDESVAQMEEQLSGACTVEVAAFDEFTTLLTGADWTSQYDHIVFDTAPTGHTLRLLQLPAAWSGFLEKNTSGVSCLGPNSGLKSSQERYARATATLADADLTTMVLVSRPERSALTEAARTSRELHDLGIDNQQLALNGVFRAESGDAVARAFEQHGREAVKQMPDVLRRLPGSDVPLRAENVLGLHSLRRLFNPANEHAALADVKPPVMPDVAPLATLVDQIESDGRGLVMVMGKGGVGKTTIASAVAVALARRDHAVHLSTTDPAAHLDQIISNHVPNLKVSRIDPKVVTREYKEHVMATAGKGLDDDGRAMLEEELRSPCTEEVAVFHAFSRIVREASEHFIILDTAPTGHTLLLLDATGSYHRQILRDMEGKQVGKVTTPMMRLQDPSYTKVLIATLPETTPVQEAAQLQADLRRAGIEPFAWIINNSLLATGTRDPVLMQRAVSEMDRIEQVMSEHAARTYIVPWQTQAPDNPERLLRIVHESPHPA